jgi:hypothetical protein
MYGKINNNITNFLQEKRTMNHLKMTRTLDRLILDIAATATGMLIVAVVVKIVMGN